MQRFGDVIRVPAEKYAEYVEKHDNIWPSIVEMMRQANIVNFTIFHRDGYLFKYYEYVGDDYEADMAVMDNSPVMQEWWKYSKPCFVGHDKGEYYEDLQEVFYFP